MVESIEVKEMAMRAKLLKETLLYEVGEFYKRWSEQLTALTQKHKLEQKNILTKGKDAQSFRMNLRICQMNKDYMAIYKAIFECVIKIVVQVYFMSNAIFGANVRVA